MKETFVPSSVLQDRTFKVCQMLSAMEMELGQVLLQSVLQEEELVLQDNLEEALDVVQGRDAVQFRR